MPDEKEWARLGLRIQTDDGRPQTPALASPQQRLTLGEPGNSFTITGRISPDPGREEILDALYALWAARDPYWTDYEEHPARAAEAVLRKAGRLP